MHTAEHPKNHLAIMVYFKNVTVDVVALVQTKLSTNQLDNIGQSPLTLTGIKGFLDMQPPMEAYETFNVVLKNPATFDVDLSDNFYNLAATADSEYQITVTESAGGAGTLVGTVWRVQGRPFIYDDGLQLDHAHFLLEQATYPVTSPAVPAGP